MQNIITIAEEGERKLISQCLVGRFVGDAWLMADGTSWEIIVTGVGAINVLKALRELPHDTRLLNIGYAGSANFDIGSIVHVAEVRLNHPCVTYDEPKLTLSSIDRCWLQAPVSVIEAVCYSNTDFVLQSSYTNCVFDMELAYIAGLGFDHLMSIKVVSDNLNLHTYHNTTSGVSAC